LEHESHFVRFNHPSSPHEGSRRPELKWRIDGIWWKTASAAGIKMTMGKNFTNRVGFILHHAPRLWHMTHLMRNHYSFMRQDIAF